MFLKTEDEAVYKIPPFCIV